MKKGFYIALFLCLIIVGATGFVITKRNIDYYSNGGIIDDNPASEEVAVTKQNKIEDAQMYEPHKSKVDEVEKNQKDQKSDEIQEDNKLQISNADEAGANTGAQEINKEVETELYIREKANEKPKATKENNKSIKQELIYPVQGEIIMDYAMDKLVYSKTLEQWIVHSGIDIKGLRGNPVKACGDGIVEKIYHDAKLGITIVIDHGDGLRTRYSNLSIDSMVKEKQHVKQGDAISGIGDTAIFEIGDEPHLHFEVLKDNKNVDPKTFLPN
jgi:murein DD-endopeptidase MepM/ murein hydrolase activator NlpD